MYQKKKEGWYGLVFVVYVVCFELNTFFLMLLIYSLENTQRLSRVSIFRYQEIVDSSFNAQDAW